MVKECKSDKKIIKPSKVTISPKSKCKQSPIVKTKLSNRKKSKLKQRIISPKFKGPEDQKSDEENRRLDQKCNKNLGPISRLKPNKISIIIAAFEDNLKNVDANHDNSDVKHEKKVVIENAFSRIMMSTRGEKTPSPGKIKKKRLEKPIPISLTKLDLWIKKEKQ